MSDINTGGPAFPVFPETGGGHAAAFQGMTLRDYFAARAMQALMRNRRIIFDLWEINDLAGDAYAMADAMLKAREKQT